MMFYKNVWTFYPTLPIKAWSFIIIAFLALPATISGDCGPGSPSFYGYTFVNPNITDIEAELAPFFLNFGQLYQEYFKSQKEIYQLDNTTEWYERYCENATLKDIRFVVYSASRYELEDLRAVMNNENANLRMLGARMANNSFIRYIFNHDCKETVDYLIFAKRCEPHVVAPADSWREIKRDVPAMQKLISEAKERFLRTESDYIKLRLAFQAIRLAHYIKDYDLTLELADYYLPKIDNDPSLVEYWIMGHQAGALQAKGELAESAYLYSRVFEKCPSKRQSAYRSFRINTDEEWDKSLLLCRNDQQRAAMYVLRAQSPRSNLIEEMQHIYEFAPQHPALEMLLVRELQKLEKDLLGEAFNPNKENNRRLHKIPRSYAGNRVIELQSLIRQWLKEEQIEQPLLWKMAQGYLEVLAGDFYFAKKTFADLAPQIPSKKKELKQQLAVFQLVLKIISMDDVSDQQEQELASLERRYKFYNDNPDFGKMVTDKLRIIYKSQGSGAKAYLMEYTLSQLRANPDIAIIDELAELCKKDKRTSFENQLVQKKDGTTILNDLLDAKSAFLLANGRLESALEVMNDIPITEWDLYGQYNPFVRRFKDCVNCPLPDTVTVFNRGQLIQKLLDIEFDARAETNPNLAASLYFDLGEAHYNLSYFGQSWKAADCFRSSSSAAIAYKQKGRVNFSHPGLPLGNFENFNVNRARQYFDQARRVATSRELKAAAAYMSAKCERNDFYVKQNRRTYEYFSILQSDFTDTEFYQKIIQECLDFQAFVLK